MRIENHVLVADTESIEVQFVKDYYHRRFAAPPTIGVIHYTVGLHAAAIANYLRTQEFLSAHVLICRSGLIRQMVPFDHVAYHCGQSSHEGREGCNNFALGIELENPGPVTQLADGSWQTTQRQAWNGDVREAQHKSGLVKSWRHWGEYSDVQVDLCAHLCALWRQQYGISDVVGHDDIAPRRKFDPGPAFPMRWLRGAVFGEAHLKSAETETV